ncbi:mannose-1-phosphate guanylyltransferase [Patescibacteria group bacterium]|nr:mannose-1-phosphate guanylyltransferase [Patescibacteria group bacterium]
MKIVILAGGSGTRLWPVSRKNKPKQIESLLGKKTLLQLTYQRIKKGFKETDIFLSINKRQLAEVHRQLPRIKKSQVIFEPVSRDTAAAIGLASAIISRKNPREIIAIVNSDHFIKNEKEFLRVLKLAGRAVKQKPDYLMLIGLNPTYPETGYGYIKLGKQIKSYNGDKIFTVDGFKEKPDLKTAKKYLKNWAYLWNPAYFVFRAETMLNLFKKYLPAQHKILMAIKKSPAKIRTEFKKIKPISIDYGIMEKAEKLLCLPANFGWADIGHWRTVQEIMAAAKTGSTCEAREVCKGKHIHLDSRGNLIYSFTNKLVATVGVKNLIVIETEDAILLCAKNKAQDVKKVVAQLKKQSLTSYL